MSRIIPRTENEWIDGTLGALIILIVSGISGLDGARVLETVTEIRQALVQAKEDQVC